MLMNTRTEIIVSGYINESQKLLSYKDNVYYNIPDLVVHKILSYLCNYFSNDGIYRWKIEDTNTINDMLNCECGTVYKSEIFDMAKLKWQLEICPNGLTEELKGYFVIHLRLLCELPSITRIAFGRIFRVVEAASGAPWLHDQNNEYRLDYWTRKCPLSCLKDINPQTITIEIYVNIFRIVMHTIDYMTKLIEPKIIKNISKSNEIPNKQRLMYQLDKNDMIHFRNSKMGKSMCSKLINDMWVIEIHPMGRTVQFKGYISTYLHLVSMPNNFEYKDFKVKYSLSCVETGDTLNFKTQLNSKKASYGPHQFIKFDSVKDMDKLTFIIDLEILQLIPMYNGAAQTSYWCCYQLVQIQKFQF